MELIQANRSGKAFLEGVMGKLGAGVGGEVNQGNGEGGCEGFQIGMRPCKSPGTGGSLALRRAQGKVSVPGEQRERMPSVYDEAGEGDRSLGKQGIADHGQVPPFLYSFMYQTFIKAYVRDTDLCTDSAKATVIFKAF